MEALKISTFLAFLAVICACFVFVSAAEAEPTPANEPIAEGEPPVAEQAGDKVLRCYECRSNKTVGVDDPCITGDLNEEHINSDCRGTDAACMKIVSHVYGMTDGDQDWEVYPPIVSRFCAKDHPLMEIGCINTSGIKGRQAACLCNDADLCNAAATPTMSLTGLLTTTMLIVFHFV